MVREFGNALGEIFKDPKVREKAQEFARSTGEAVQAFIDKFKEEEVKQRFKQAGRAAEEFGQKVAKRFGTSKEKYSQGNGEKFPRSDFEIGVEKAVQQGISIVLHVFSLAVILSFLTVFPFNFDIVPFPNAAQVLSIIVAIVFIAIAIGLIVGIVVKIVRIVITTIRLEI